VKNVKSNKNWLVAIPLTILLVSLATPLIALPISAHEGDDDDVRIIPGTWYRLESPIITVLFPREAKKPMFLWWYTDEPDQVYVVKFQGLIEWFAFDNPMLPQNPEYYNHMREAWEETWRERFEDMYFKPEEDRWMGMGDMGMRDMLRSIMYQIMWQMQLQWHRPFLPFDAGRWNLIPPANITTTDGKIIGVSFGFRLVDIWLPRFQFAKDNILIRVRFYNQTVEETVPGTNFKYTVNAGEMKMDLVINEWKWNIDAIKQLILQLQQAGFNIQIPAVRSRLALWVNLASINITRLPLEDVQDRPDEIEEHPEDSTVTHMEIEDMHTDISENRTARPTEYERPIEIPRPIIKLRFANQTKTLGGFFRFVSSAKVTDYPNTGDVNMVPVKAAYIAGGAHMRLFIGYPYFGNGTLEHDPSIGVDVAGLDTTPKYSVQVPTGLEVTPAVLGQYVFPLFTTELMIALIAVGSTVALILYLAKWKRKTPVNMVGVGTAPTGTTG